MLNILLQSTYHFSITFLNLDIFYLKIHSISKLLNNFFRLKSEDENRLTVLTFF